MALVFINELETLIHQLIGSSIRLPSKKFSHLVGVLLEHLAKSLTVFIGLSSKKSTKVAQARG